MAIFSPIPELLLCDCCRCGRYLMGPRMIEMWESLPKSYRDKCERGYQFVAGWETVWLDWQVEHRRPICRGCL